MGCTRTAVVACFAKLSQCVFNRRPIHGPPEMPWLWKAKSQSESLQAILRKFAGYQCGSATCLIGIRIGTIASGVRLHSAQRHAMCGEQDGGRMPELGYKSAILRTQAVSKGRDEQRVIRPCISEIHCEFAAGLGQHRAAIEADAGAGILWSEADGGSGGDAVVDHLLHCRGDIRLPVAHADVDRYSGVLRQQTRLRTRDLRQRAFANQAIAMGYLVDGCLWQCAATGHVAEILGYFVERVRCAVRQQQNRCFHRGGTLLRRCVFAHKAHGGLDVLNREFRGRCRVRH